MSLRECLALEPGEDGSYVARPPGSGYLFGGLSLALALRAAGSTVPSGMRPQSCHTYFQRPGRWEGPTELAVAHEADRRNFAFRRVTVSQDGEPLAVMTASFHHPSPGNDWQADVPVNAPPAGGLQEVPALLPLDDLIELRPSSGTEGLDRSVHPYWARSARPLGEDPLLHSSALAFVSDYLVILSVLVADPGIPDPTSTRTISQAVWFHRPANAEAWHLFSAEPRSLSDGRGLVNGSVQDEGGTLVASFAQEVAIRY